MAAYGEIDDVIDPADSRRWIATLFDEGTGQWRRRGGEEAPEHRRLVTVLMCDCAHRFQASSSSGMLNAVATGIPEGTGPSQMSRANHLFVP